MNLSKLMVAALLGHLKSNKPPVIPAGGMMIWSWFCALSGARSYHAYGPNPLAWRDIESYFRLMRIPIQRHHLEIILALDQAFLQHQNQSKASAPDGVKTLQPRSPRPLSAALFDAMTG